MATIIDKNFVVTTPEISGYRIVKYLGIVRGLEICAHLKKDSSAGMEGAMDKMISMAQEKGANAVVGVHYNILSEDNKFLFADTICYGTAVSIEPLTTT